MNHDELCRRAAHWLRRTKRCDVVAMRKRWFMAEEPDALGWKISHRGESILVECKASRGDFRADATKWFRKVPSDGMGDLRYYFAPRNVIPIAELPPNWGLLECWPKFVRVIREASRFETKNVMREQQILIALANAGRSDDWQACEALAEPEFVI